MNECYYAVPDPWRWYDWVRTRLVYADSVDMARTLTLGFDSFAQAWDACRLYKMYIADHNKRGHYVKTIMVVEAHYERVKE